MLQIVGDVAITHPSASSVVVQASTRPLFAAGKREQQKYTKYKNRERDGYSVVGFVFETYGAAGNGVRKVVKALAKHSPILGGLEFTSYAMTALSIALQAGNAMIALGGSQHMRARAFATG